MAGEAAAISPPPAPGAAGAPGAATAEVVGPNPTETNAQVLGTVLALMRTVTAEQDWLFNPPLQSTATHLSDRKIQMLVLPWAEVLTHYGWDLADMLDHPIVKALVLTGGPLYAMVRAILQELSDRNNAAAAARPVDDPGRPE